MVIHSELVWEGKRYRLKYVDVDNFEGLLREKCKQIYGACFFKNKLVITYNNITKQWNLVGGSIKKNETFEEALRREIQEETNMELLEYASIGYQASTDPDGDTIFQLRTACLVKPLGPFHTDPTGAVTKIKLIDPLDYKKYFDWGKIGDRIIERAVEAKKRMAMGHYTKSWKEPRRMKN
jgi:ADP-ribose pyrophosphatase YjhB (NUDIX family)